MIQLHDNLAAIRKTQAELNECKEKGPHWRDLQRRLRKLRYERAEALRHLKEAGRI